MKKLINKHNKMHRNITIHGVKSGVLMAKQSFVCLLLLLLTGCFASAPAGDDNSVDYTDYGIIQPSSNVVDDDVIYGGERYFSLNTVSAVATNAAASLTSNPSFNSLNQTITLPALAIERHDITEYQRAIGATDWQDINIIRTITVTDIISPVLSLELDGSGNIETVIAYFADNSYFALSENLSQQGFSNSISDGASDGADSKYIQVDKRDDAFGFTTQYMARIEWTLSRDERVLTATNPEDNIYDTVGVMVAGIETDASALPSSDIIAFQGEGQGEYGEEEKKYQTVFDVIAHINFTTNLATIYSSKTMQCTDNDCKIGAGNLDFRATNLSFSKNNLAVNAINGVLFLIGDTSLTGNISARFYGPNADELGGTFALTEKNERYYFGTFGGENTGIVDDKDYDVNDADEDGNDDNGLPPIATTLNATIDYDGYDSLDEASAALTANTLTLPALAVQRHTGTSPNLQRFTKPSNESPFLSLSFDGSGFIAAATASFENTPYTLTGGMPASSAILSGATNVTATTNNMRVIRADSARLGSFTPKYMAYVTWQLENNLGVDSDGYMVAGIETASTGIDSIPTEGITIFQGKGIGTYKSSSGTTHAAVKFDARAKVNFTNQTVAVSGTNTSCVAACGLTANALLNLEFDTSNNISSKYRKEANVIGGTIENADATMQGRFDARFYGKNAIELGGTFIMKNDDNSSYYLGAFGAERP